jgi:hypothetical protein
LVFACGATLARANDFRFERDTFSFANSTVFEYSGGFAQGRSNATASEKVKRYTRRCFVMSRGALQFYKFARFEPSGKPLPEAELKERVRQVARMQPWQPALPADQRIVFPGYRDLRHLSGAHASLLQENLGLGWPTYTRIGNYRMFFRQDDSGYQTKMHEELARTIGAGGFFVAYLTDYPHFRINHAVLVYARRPSSSESAVEHYVAYDPNHPDRPRELKWSNAMHVFNFEKDKEFPGGFTKVYQVYGKWLQ